MRAIAVLAVLLYHAGLPFLPGGYVGVDIFFVISGFLITSHLLRGLERDGRVHFASFYAKRARRILPASFVVLVLSVVAALIWYPPLLMEEVWRGGAATALYAPNLLFAVDGTNYLAETTPSLFQHYWSLGIEEQFYLVWPLLLAIGWRFIRSRRALFVVLLAVVAVSFLACVLLTYRAQPWAFFSLPTRAWELGVGGVVAFALTARSQMLPPPAAAFIGWVGLGGVLGSVAFFDAETPFPGYMALVPVASTALIILAGATPSAAGPGAVLSARPMLWVGAISYSLYLVHWPALMIPQAAAGFTSPLPLWVTVLIAAACVPVAWALYKWVETPLRSTVWLARARPRRTLLAALAGSVACVAIAAAAYGYSNTRPLHTEQVAAETVASESPAATSFVPANLKPSLRDASDDQPEIYADGCHQSFASTDATGCLYGEDDAPRIVIFGDSHAGQWFPAVESFAQTYGYAVQVFTKSSCRSLMMPQLRDGVPYSECTIWRDRVIDKLNEETPALVLLSNYSGGFSSSTPDAWADGLSETLDRVRAPSAVIADSPDLGFTPSICLSAHLSDAAACAVPASQALRPQVRDVEAQVAFEHDVPVVDLAADICTDECAPIIGNTLVYRDGHHLTATFAASLAAPLGDQLTSILATDH